MKFEIAFRWEDVESGPGEPYRFPDSPTRHMRKYRVPGVYRWAAFNHDAGLEAMYVGEAEDLERRLKHYLKPGKSQFTNLRIKALLEDYQSRGMEIRLQLVAFDDFIFNSCKLVSTNLSDPFARGLIENLTILEVSQTKCTVLNKGMDVTRKKIALALKAVTSNFTAQEKNKLIEKLMDSLKPTIPS